MPKVYNKRRPNEIPVGAVYIGRPSKWGNPFSNGSKEQNIEDFREYAEDRICQEPNWLDDLKGKNLVCWCSPSGCHGDVLVEMANQADNDWDQWADENAPDSLAYLDQPSDWERMNGLA